MERDINPTNTDLRDYNAVVEVTMELDEPPKEIINKEKSFAIIYIREFSKEIKRLLYKWDSWGGKSLGLFLLGPQPSGPCDS